MAEALPPEVERLASFGRALEGSVDITQEDIDEVPSDEGSPSANLEALPPAKVDLLGHLKKKRTYLYRVCTRLRRETKANENVSSERWNQLAEGAVRHLDDLTTIDTEILKPSKKDREKAKSYKKNLREMIAIFGEFRDSQLQIEQEGRRSARQPAKEVLSDTRSDQERDFETADEFNCRLEAAVALTANEPDATVRLPETSQKKDARVHFDQDQGQEATPVGTGRQEQVEANTESDSSGDTSSGDDELEKLKQQLAIKDYNEKVLKEQLATKERELAEVDLRNRQLAHKLDKERRENLKLSGELSKRPVTSSSGTSDPNARTALPTLTKDTGSKDPTEQSRSDRELRKTRLQPDLSYDFRSRQGDFAASSPAYPGLARGASGGAITGDQPPGDRNPSRPFRPDSGAVDLVDGDLSSPVNLPYPGDPLKGLNTFQMTKFGGKESQYEYWKLQFQASYGARTIPVRDKTLFL
jgi:hypothetical protein